MIPFAFLHLPDTFEGLYSIEPHPSLVGVFLHDIFEVFGHLMFEGLLKRERETQTCNFM